MKKNALNILGLLAVLGIVNGLSYAFNWGFWLW